MKFVAIFILALVSCVPSKPLPPRLWEWSPADIPMTVIVDDDLRPETLIEIAKAIEWWNEEAERELFAPIGEITPGSIVVILAIDDDSLVPYEGLASKSGMTVGVYLRERSRTLARVIRHELGHALGLPHNEDRSSVMFAEALFSDYVATEEDIENIP